MYKLIRNCSNLFRTFFWKHHFKTWGEGSSVYGRIFVAYPENICLGARCTINEGVILNAVVPLEIEDHVRISYRSIITTGELDLTKPYENRPHRAEVIRIGRGAWIGAGAILLPGVNIGEGSVVAAGSVVTSDVPSFTVVAGVPARFLKKVQKAD